MEEGLIREILSLCLNRIAAEGNALNTEVGTFDFFVFFRFKMKLQCRCWRFRERLVGYRAKTLRKCYALFAGRHPREYLDGVWVLCSIIILDIHVRNTVQ